jgi:hypothetical protein
MLELGKSIPNHGLNMKKMVDLTQWWIQWTKGVQETLVFTMERWSMLELAVIFVSFWNIGVDHCWPITRIEFKHKVGLKRSALNSWKHIVNHNYHNAGHDDKGSILWVSNSSHNALRQSYRKRADSWLTELGPMGSLVRNRGLKNVRNLHLNKKNTGSLLVCGWKLLVAP